MQRETVLTHVLQRVGMQMTDMGLPQHLHRSACEKIIDQVFDGGRYFQFQYRSDDNDEGDGDEDEKGDNDHAEDLVEGPATAAAVVEEPAEDCAEEESSAEDVMVKRKFNLVAVEEMKSLSNVFLLDHMWLVASWIPIYSLSYVLRLYQDHEFSPKQVPVAGTSIAGYSLRLVCVSIYTVLCEHNDLNISTASIFELPEEAEELLSSPDCHNNKELVNLLWDKMWPLLNSYNIDGSDAYTTWYLMDEVGSAISHNRFPNCRVYPIYVNLEGIPGLAAIGYKQFGLSLLWPIKDIEVGDIITRDYLPMSYANQLVDEEGFGDMPLIDRIGILKAIGADKAKDQVTLELLRHLKGIGYFDVPVGLRGSENAESTLEVIGSIADEALTCIKSQQDTEVSSRCSLLNDSPSEWARINDKLQTAAAASVTAVNESTPPLRIFCDRDDYLSAQCVDKLSNRFVFVSDSADADILYLIDHVIDSTDSEHDKSGKLLTQFWWEGMIVTKNHFIRTMKAAFEKLTAGHSSNDGAHTDAGCWPWIAPTYDLSKPKDFASFVKHYVSIQQKSANNPIANMWLLKKFTGRQGIDYPITNNLSCAIRHTDLWPRLACKYISQPCLYRQCKFDLRYYVVVLSLSPLRLLRHKIFIPRASNIPYSLEDFECYQKHFTVMGFLEEKTLLQDIRGQGVRRDPLMAEFMTEFDAEQREKLDANTASGALQWEQHIQPEVDKVLRNIFECVAAVAEDEPAHPSGRPLHRNAGNELVMF
jgi:hypothetical protein